MPARYIKGSLNRQILFVAIAVAVAIGMVFGYVTYSSVKTAAYRHLESNITVLVDDTLLTIRDPVFNFDTDTVRMILDIRLSGYSYLDAVIVYQEGESRKVFAGRMVEKGLRPVSIASEPKGEFFRVVRKDIFMESQRIGQAAFFLNDQEAKDEIAGAVRRLIGILAMFIVTLVAAIHSVMNRVITLPIKGLIEEINATTSDMHKEKKSSGTLKKLEAGILFRPDEIGALHRAMDSLFRAREGELTRANLRLAKAIDTLAAEVNERKAAQEGLMEREILIKSIIDNSPAIFWLKDHSGKYIMCNKAYEDFLAGAYGFTSSAGLAGLTDREILPLEAASENQELDQRAIKGSAPVITEHSVERDGKRFHYLASRFTLRSPGGSPNAVAGICTDISIVKEYENKLQEAKNEVEEATMIKNIFVSLVSQDLRPALGSITLTLDSAAGSGENKEEIQEAMRKASTEAKRLQDIIGQLLLDVGSFHSGKIKLSKKFVPAHRLVGGKMDMISMAADRKGISLTNEIPVNMRVHADPSLFGDVILNLLTNAIKFTKPGGAISVFCPPGRPSTVAVRDTGVGIPQHILPDLFKHEVKTTSQGLAGEKGTGLGLPHAFDIMAAHGGSLSVESEQGKGSVFYAELPQANAVALVVEDVDAHRASMVALLRQIQGLEVIEAADGIQALEKMRLIKPHIIITDTFMPRMDGFGLLEALRASEEWATVPVIAVTSTTASNPGDDINLRSRVFSAGADDLVTKPVFPSDFLPRVRRFLGFT